MTRGLPIVLRVQVVSYAGFNTAALGRNSPFAYGPSSWTLKVLNSSLQTVCFEVGHFDSGRLDIAVCEYCSR